MDKVVYFIRDDLVGFHYFMYAFFVFYLMFAIIGYLLKEKYARFDIKTEKVEEIDYDKIRNQIKLGKGEPEFRNHGKVPKNSMIHNTVLNKTATTIVNTPSSMGEVIISKKENVPSDTFLISKPDSISSPKPMPNIERVVKPIPKPMPNVETKTPTATPVAKNNP